MIRVNAMCCSFFWWTDEQGKRETDCRAWGQEEKEDNSLPRAIGRRQPKLLDETRLSVVAKERRSATCCLRAVYVLCSDWEYCWKTTCWGEIVDWKKKKSTYEAELGLKWREGGLCNRFRFCGVGLEKSRISKRNWTANNLTVNNQFCN